MMSVPDAYGSVTHEAGVRGRALGRRWSVAPWALLAACSLLASCEDCTGPGGRDGGLDGGDAGAAGDSGLDGDGGADAQTGDAVQGGAGGEDAGGGGGDGSWAGTGGLGGSGGGSGASGFGGLPQSETCGDAIRDPDWEECDDGPGALLDACDAQCRVRDVLVWPAEEPDAGLRNEGQWLGRGRHTVVAESGGVGVVAVRAPSPAGASEVHLHTMSSGLVPQASSPVGQGTRVTFDANPVVARTGPGELVVAFTDFGADGDALGVALRRVSGFSDPAQGPLRHANATRAFSQRDPDLVWTGRELVVAWVDESAPFGAPDVKVRRFDAGLAPLEDERPLGVTLGAESDVALVAFSGSWAAAWRRGEGGFETLEVRAGVDQWSLGAHAGGAAGDKPALVALDGSRLFVAYTVGTDPVDAGQGRVARLRGALLKAGVVGPLWQGAIEPLVPPWTGAPSLHQDHPAAVLTSEGLYVAWRSSTALPARDDERDGAGSGEAGHGGAAANAAGETGPDASDATTDVGDASAGGGTAGHSLRARGEELWLKRIPFIQDDGGGIVLPVLDLPEIPLPRGRYAGDQRRAGLALLSPSPTHPAGALVMVWEDHGLTFGAPTGAPDLAAELVPLPLLRLEGLGGGTP